MRRALLTVAAPSIALPVIGDAFMGGYYAGVIDTTKGNIIAADASQTGQRYALIVAPKSLETETSYKTSATAAPAAAKTKWDGLTATASMATTTYPAANYCNGLTYPSDGGSKWYLPAMDELELLFRYLKPSTNTNATGSRPLGTFPGIAASRGENSSSDPTGAAYTDLSPAQTAVTVFKSGGSECFTADRFYRSATDFDTANAWVQFLFGSTGTQGNQSGGDKTNSAYIVRPVRRVVL